MTTISDNKREADHAITDEDIEREFALRALAAEWVPSCGSIDMYSKEGFEQVLNEWFVPLSVGEFRVLLEHDRLSGGTRLDELALLYRRKPDRLAADRAHVRKVREGFTIKNVRVEWIEWAGTSAKYLRPKPRVEEGASVFVKGKMVTVTLADGETFTKRRSTENFRYEKLGEYRRRIAAEKREERERVRAMNAQARRFRQLVKGQKFEACEYFEWRDRHNRNSAATTWRPITLKEIEQALRRSGEQYATRTCDRIENGHRSVVRVGLHLGIRRLRSIEMEKAS